MATFIISDVHGEYQKLLEILDKIHFNDADTLYLLGDMIDRGKQSLKILQFAMKHSNVITIMGNHEYMAIGPLTWLYYNDLQNFEDMNVDIKEQFIEWLNVGGKSTIDEYQLLAKNEQNEILIYLNELLQYKELEINGNNFVLVHAGIDNFSPVKELSEYKLEELIFNKPFYYLKYFENKFLVT
ncbi:metallophosphoesterase [Candidatus Enterococcus huntleyi]|uniref:metallophosphoesterase n=1 Tax=Candidatus Enterococcus huntleyi TaxID=1857217 RepID=UPI00137A0CBF|nr:metallophosphoesterase [Enterococcus sp. JM4C]